MRTLDRILQRWRMAKALPWVRPGDHLLDLGCADGVLLRAVADRIERGVGVDPLAEPRRDGKLEILRGTVPGEPVFADASFDCVTMLAVLEHVPDTESLARECFRLLRPAGRVVLTVPRAAVDHILHALVFIRLIDGMSLEEHHDFDIARVPAIFEGAGFRLIRRRGFQLGLNQLFVFERPGDA